MSRLGRTVDHRRSITVVLCLFVAGLSTTLGGGLAVAASPIDWNQPSVLSEHSEDPSLATCKTGSAAAATWVTRTSNAYQIHASIYSDQGGWSQSAMLESSHRWTDYPTVAIGGQSCEVISVVWFSQLSRNRSVVRASTFNKLTGRWSIPVTLTEDSMGFIWMPKVSVGPGGTAVAAWPRKVSSSHFKIEASVLNPGTYRWGSPTVLDNRYNYFLMFDSINVSVGLKSATVVWTNGGQVYISRRSNGSWSKAPSVLDEDGFDTRYADVVTDGSDRSAVIWDAIDDDDSSQKFVRSVYIDREGKIGDPAKVGSGDYSDIDIDNSGNTVAAWKDNNDLESSSFGSAADSSWGEPYKISVEGKYVYEGAPRVAIDANGNVATVWIALDDGQDGRDYVAVSAAGGIGSKQWSTPETFADEGDADIGALGLGALPNKVMAIWMTPYDYGSPPSFEQGQIKTSLGNFSLSNPSTF